MKKLFLSLFILSLFTSLSNAQIRNQRRQVPQNVNQEKEKEKYEEKAEKAKKEYISGFVATLKVDDFQKEIITQSMDSYFEEIKKINMLGLNTFERKEYIEKFDKRHFKDVEQIVSEDIMSKIMDAVKGKWDQKEAKKKKKKRKKKEN
ncbi:hypothetical protein [Psychroserpens sp. SPM9]|uniref:hypothetical protein n=1 Tax=Psychroserpens sp. SPM9 TaxID=2975598 RepID=UPI0021A3AA5E|nr:hypothetical protein [Psychroserpens sp. SPM9]MDG5491884.1 hypothetical protein [Psychroserpens sp. SPM9]